MHSGDLYILMFVIAYYKNFISSFTTANKWQDCDGKRLFSSSFIFSTKFLSNKIIWLACLHPYCIKIFKQSHPRCQLSWIQYNKKKLFLHINLFGTWSNQRRIWYPKPWDHQLLPGCSSSGLDFSDVLSGDFVDSSSSLASSSTSAILSSDGLNDWFPLLLWFWGTASVATSSPSLSASGWLVSERILQGKVGELVRIGALGKSASLQCSTWWKMWNLYETTLFDVDTRKLTYKRFLKKRMK